MNKREKVALLGTALVALAACAPQAPDTAAEAASIMAGSLAWFQHYNAGDADGVAALYAEDALLLPVGAPKVAGRAAIRDWAAVDIKNSKAAGLAFKGDPVTDGVAQGNTAWITGSFSVSDASGRKVDTGKYVTVYRRTDGKWLIVRDIWNSDGPAAPASSVVITARVADSKKWEEGFRTHGELFKSQTARSPVRYAVIGGNEVAVNLEVDDLEKGLSILDSKATADAMAFDGVKRDTVKVFVLDKKLDLD